MVAVGSSDTYNSNYRLYFSTFIFETSSPYRVTSVQQKNQFPTSYQIIELYIADKDLIFALLQL